MKQKYTCTLGIAALCQERMQPWKADSIERLVELALRGQPGKAEEGQLYDHGPEVVALALLAASKRIAELQAKHQGVQKPSPATPWGMVPIHIKPNMHRRCRTSIHRARAMRHAERRGRHSICSRLRAQAKRSRCGKVNVGARWVSLSRQKRRYAWAVRCQVSVRACS